MSTDASDPGAAVDDLSRAAVAPAVDEPILAAAPLPPRRKKTRWARWVGLAVLVVVVGLIASTVRPGQGAFVYSKYVDEVVAQPQRYVNTELRVEGIVQAGSLENRAGSNEYRFRVTRNNREMPVQYEGIVPDTFREGIGVTVRGRLRSDGQFIAHEVIAKCPSKYEMQAASARGEQMPAGMIPTPQPSTPSLGP